MNVYCISVKKKCTFIIPKYLEITRIEHEQGNRRIFLIIKNAVRWKVYTCDILWVNEHSYFENFFFKWRHCYRYLSSFLSFLQKHVKLCVSNSHSSLLICINSDLNFYAILNSHLQIELFYTAQVDWRRLELFMSLEN